MFTPPQCFLKVGHSTSSFLPHGNIKEVGKYAKVPFAVYRTQAPHTHVPRVFVAPRRVCLHIGSQSQEFIRSGGET